MIKKHNFLLLVIISFLSVTLHAQKKVTETKQKENFEKKINFFKKNLSLNEIEQKNFEDAYRSYLKQKKDLHIQYRKEVIQKIYKNELNKLSKEEQEKIIDKKINIDKKRFYLSENFIIKLRKILPPEKVIKYFKLEHKYNHKSVKQKRKIRREKKSQTTTNNK